MLVIRMQRTGRSGHAQFRVVVQDSRRTPTSGKIVAQVGSYNPHSKQTTLDKEKAQFYLDHGAQPSPRVARLLKAEGVKLPAWVEIEEGKKREVRNADKRRSTRPPEPEAPVEETAEAPVEETAPVEEAAEAPAEEAAPANEEVAEEVAEAPAEAEASEETATEPEAAAEETPAEATPAEPTAEAEEAPDEEEKAAE